MPVILPGVAGVPGFTVMVILLLVAVVGEAQAALDVITTFITSPFDKVELVNVGLLVPAAVPFTYH